MNRNDLMVVSSASSGASGGTVSPRSPQTSSTSPSPSSRSKKSASALFTGGTGMGLPKGAPLLEGESVHLALPSFHARSGGKSGVWKCQGCMHENHSALSNECSVCGMVRTASFHDSHRSQGTGSSDPSDNTFMCDEDHSENSLSLNNSFSAVDPRIDEELAMSSSLSGFGHASLPTFHAASGPVPASARMHNSFSVESTTARRSRASRRARGGGARRRVSARFNEEEGNSSVRSFSDWDGNEQIKSWQCPTCTFINENILQLQCEMCGHLRENSTTGENGFQQDGVIHPPTREQEDAYLNQLQEEQLRELMTLQQEIMDSLDAPGGEPQPSSFGTHALEREIGAIQDDMESRGHHHESIVPGASALDFAFDSDSADDAEDDEARLQELLAAQTEILKGFQQARNRDPGTSAAQTPSSQATQKPSAASATPGSRTATAVAEAAQRNTYHDPLFGGHGPSNTAPQTSMSLSLKESMEAAGGKLRIEDICVPLLWGDNIRSGGKHAAGGKIQT